MHVSGSSLLLILLFIPLLTTNNSHRYLDIYIYLPAVTFYYVAKKICEYVNKKIITALYEEEDLFIVSSDGWVVVNVNSSCLYSPPFNTITNASG